MTNKDDMDGGGDVKSKSRLMSLASDVLASLFLPAATAALVYSWNSDRTTTGDLLNAALVLFLINAILVIVLTAVFRFREGAATLVNAAFVGCVIGAYFIEGFQVIWAIAWLIICIVLVVKPSIRSTIQSLTTSISAAVLCLAGYNFVTTSPLVDTGDKAPDLLEAFENKRTTLNQPTKTRDVYYLIFDRYARADVLQDIYGFDNSGFLNELRQRGFLVADDAYSNYPRTAHSLASSLNLDYLNREQASDVGQSRDWRVIHDLIERSESARLLKDNGYEFHFLGSWWEPTRKNQLADETVNYRAWPELIRVLFENSIFGVAADQFQVAAVNPRQIQCQRAKIKFETLKQLAGSSDPQNPKFVFAHFLVPHPPFVFDADGSCLSVETAKSRSREENYVNQVKYTNAAVLQFLDKVHTYNGEKPIIILQADEGPWPKKYVADEIHLLGRDVMPVEWDKVTANELREKMGILNALYLPESEIRTISAQHSPVNNMRLVFREYFGADLPELPDEAYIFPNNSDLYRFENVDDKLRER